MCLLLSLIDPCFDLQLSLCLWPIGAIDPAIDRFPIDCDIASELSYVMAALGTLGKQSP